MDKPCLIFNCDETGMPLAPAPSKVVAVKGDKHPYSINSGNRAQITVLSCCSAAGYAIPPLVVFDRKILKPEMANEEVPGTMYGMSSSGWMDAELFDLWFRHHFLAHAPPARPLLLLLDGHSSHYEPTFVQKAAAEEVIVFCLPPHTTHITQPLDNGCFGPLKRLWKEECQQYCTKNPGRVVTRLQFSQLFSRAWYRGMTMENIVSGFRHTGVYPFNRDALLPKPAKLTFDPTSLMNKTGLRYIPLYSPARPSRPAPLQFTPDEIVRYQRRYEVGYDVTDERYRKWLSMYHPQSHFDSKTLSHQSPPTTTQDSPSPTLLPQDNQHQALQLWQEPSSEHIYPLEVLPHRGEERKRDHRKHPGQHKHEQALRLY